MYVLRRPGVAKFAEIIKILTMFIKKVFKDFKNAKRFRNFVPKFPPPSLPICEQPQKGPSWIGLM